MPALNVNSLVPNKDYLIYNSYLKRALKTPQTFVKKTSDGFLYFSTGIGSSVGYNPKLVQIYNVSASDYPANTSSAPVSSSSAAPSAPVSSSSAAPSAPVSSSSASAAAQTPYSGLIDSHSGVGYSGTQWSTYGYGPGPSGGRRTKHRKTHKQRKHKSRKSRKGRKSQKRRRS